MSSDYTGEDLSVLAQTHALSHKRSLPLIARRCRVPVRRSTSTGQHRPITTCRWAVSKHVSAFELVCSQEPYNPPEWKAPEDPATCRLLAGLLAGAPTCRRHESRGRAGVTLPGITLTLYKADISNTLPHTGFLVYATICPGLVAREPYTFREHHGVPHTRSYAGLTKTFDSDSCTKAATPGCTMNYNISSTDLGNAWNYKAHQELDGRELSRHVRSSCLATLAFCSVHLAPGMMR